MRSSRPLPWALAALLATLPLAAAEPSSDDVEARREVNPDFREFRREPLGSNVFQQTDSLEVSADQAVTFPSDF